MPSRDPARIRTLLQPSQDRLDDCAEEGPDGQWHVWQEAAACSGRDEHSKLRNGDEVSATLSEVHKNLQDPFNCRENVGPLQWRRQLLESGALNLF
jgi:hypothetical protein